MEQRRRRGGDGRRRGTDGNREAAGGDRWLGGGRRGQMEVGEGKQGKTKGRPKHQTHEESMVKLRG